MRKIGIVMILCLTLGLYGFSPGCGGEKNNDNQDDSPKTIYHVTYMVISYCRTLANVSYQDLRGLQHKPGVKLPFYLTMDAPAGNYVYLSASDPNFAPESLATKAIGMEIGILKDSDIFKADFCIGDPNCSLSVDGIL